MNVERSAPRGPVFLSYASQDADAARRICETLRAAGIEVWFDQSELTGGDAWDQKIRGQIKACALFVPVISAHTNARREGYFRREWKLAVDRTHDMDEALPFLLPVVIDGTTDAGAFVPEKFREVQWTRLPRGETPAPFCERVKTLLEGEVAFAGSDVGASLDGARGRGRATPLQNRHRRWLVPGVVALAAIVALAVWRPWRAKETSPPISAANAPALIQTEAQRLVAKAWEHLNRPGLDRGGLEIADDFCKRATTLSPDDADAWAAWSQVDSWYIYGGLDRTPERKESARTKAARALRLAPKSFEARLAEACYLVRGLGAGGQASSTAQFSTAVEKTLRELLGEQPNEPRACFALGLLLRSAGRLDEAYAAFDRMAETEVFAATANSEKGWVQWAHGDFAAAQAACDRSLALQPFAGNLLLQIYLALSWTGDLELARAAVERTPPTLLQEDALASYAARVYWWRREPNQMLRVLNAVHRPWLTFTNSPKDYLVGHARRMAGSEQAAQVSWREAARQVDLRMEKDPQPSTLRWWKAELLGLLGRAEESKAAARQAQELGSQSRESPFSAVGDWSAALAVGDNSEAIRSLEKSFANKTWVTTAAILRLNPLFDPLRTDPRFQALLARAEADPLRSPRAKGSLTANEAPAAATVKLNEKSVAVLAFENKSDDKANELFSDGLSEDLIGVLGRVPGLTVTGWTSSLFLKTKNLPTAEIGRQLGVAYVVRGSVWKTSSTGVRITAQVSRAANDVLVWSSEPMDRDMKDSFKVRDEIAGLIAQALSLKLGVESAARAVEVNPEAYRLFLEGRCAWNLRTQEGLDQAEALLNRALVLEPRFARAHAALADVGAVQVSDSSSERKAALRAKSVAHAEQAISLDPNLAEPHATLGLLENSDWSFDAADRHFQRALARNRSYAWAHLWRVQSLTSQGRMDEALAENQRALEADPLAMRIMSNTALLLLLAGRSAEAVALADRTLALQPGEFQAQTWKTEALLMLGREEEALKIAREALAINPRRRDFTYVLANAGNPQEVAAALSAPDHRFANHTRSLLATDRLNEAFAGLEADVRGSMFSFQFVLFHPAFDAIRKDPRFEKMLEGLRMTEVHARAQAWRAANPPEKSAAKN